MPEQDKQEEILETLQEILAKTREAREMQATLSQALESLHNEASVALSRLTVTVRHQEARIRFLEQALMISRGGRA